MRLGARLTYADPTDPRPRALLIRAIELLTGQPALERVYLDALAAGPDAFWRVALQGLEITLDWSAARLAAIPRHGPLVLVANHPFGLVDGLALCHLAQRVRGDFRILIHRAMCREPALDRFLLPVDFTGDPAGARVNAQSLRRAITWTREGGALLVFPAGGIATAARPCGPVSDLEWKPAVARLIQAARATVVPVFFHGRNTWLFQLVSQFSLTLRLALVLHEANQRRGGALRVTIGAPVPFSELAEFATRDRDALLERLRTIVYATGGVPAPPPVTPGALAR